MQRDYKVVESLPTIKDRNRVVREMTGDGWNVETGGSKRYGYRVSGWKGEKPVALRSTIRIGVGAETVPMYRSAGGGWELADGSRA